MPRVNAYVPDELFALVHDELPDVNVSAVLQAGLRAALHCRHDELECARCGTKLGRHELVGPALERFFVAVMRRLGENTDRPGYEGAARIVHRLAADHGVPGVTTTPQPRPSRAQIKRRGDVVALPLEADSRRRHPTAQEATG